jgi:hypothetical protein
MSQLSAPAAPLPGVAYGVAVSLIPAAVICLVAVLLNWGR